jgi:hypothetical protein
MAGLSFVVYSKLRSEVWSYFTDDEGTRVEVEEEKTRYVLWQDPKQNLFAETGFIGAPLDKTRFAVATEATHPDPEANLSAGIPFINYADAWDFNDQNLNLGTSWKESNYSYSHAGWTREGAAENNGGLYGFESAGIPAPGIRTPLLNSSNEANHITYYFRKEFEYPGSLAGVTITVDQIADDGATYYLNGTPIGGAGTSAGVDWKMEASRNIGDADEEPGVVSREGSALVNGTNVLAAEVHQTNEGSSDCVFGARFSIFVPGGGEDAETPADPVNQPTGRLEAAFSADETHMVLVHWDKERMNADLFSSSWNGRLWSRPAPLAALNTEANERGPAFSQDGRHLYFSSDRKGGQGGYDLYVTRWDGTGWSEATALRTTINSPANEGGPALARDDAQIYFSSNREGGAADIFVAQRTAEVVETPEEESVEAEPDKKKPNEVIAEAVPELPPIPRYGQAQSVSHLNSEADDVQAALTKRGSQVFLASDRDQTKKTGFGLYFSRVVDGRRLTPERVDLYITKGDLTDPAVRMEGFDLLFSNGAADENGYLLYQSTTREVIGYTDLSQWEQFKKLMGNIGKWILLALVALIALLYLLEAWQDISSLFHKCLAGSAAVHLIILFLLALWLIVRQVEGGDLQSPQVAISIEALAQEDLALESEPEHAEIADTKNLVMTEKFDSDFKIPVFRPMENAQVTPIVTKTSKTSLVPDVRPSKVNEAESDQAEDLPTQELAVLTSLPESFLPEPDNPELEEQEVTDQQKTEKPADPTDDLFKPTEALEQVENERATERQLADTAVENDSEAKDVAQTQAAPQATDTGGDLINAHRGLEALGAPPKLEGAGDTITNLLNLPGDAAQSDPLLPGELETPKHALDPKSISKLIQKQRGKPSLDTIKELGGSDATEKAIGDALEWLARNQEPDGRWDVRKHGGNGDYDTGGTGAALLCFYGWGIRHDRGHKYQQHVKRGVAWLVKQQKENGDLRGKGRMYCHGIASIALCEAYGATKDPALKGPAEKSIALILASQSTTKGGWRYNAVNKNGQPDQDSDLSVTGWQYMALHSARLAGLEVPDEVFTRAQGYLSQVAGGKHGGLYGYVPGNINPSMVATGMFCRQLDLVPPTDPRMQEGAEYLGQKKLKAPNPDFYYVYYATLALYQHQGVRWHEWNEDLKKTLPLIQKKEGAERGSWDRGSGHGSQGGRLLATTLSVLSLEVYYRLLPMYGFRNNEALPAPKAKAN